MKIVSGSRSSGGNQKSPKLAEFDLHPAPTTLHTPWRAARRQWLLLFAALGLLVAALASQRGLGRVDYTLYDAVISLSGRAAPDDIVIVAIDAQSLSQIGRWPWRRAVHATLLDRIAADSPRGIAFDLILSEPETGGGAVGTSASVSISAAAPQPDGDASFAAALASAKVRTRVVLPVLRETRNSAGLALAKPIAPFAAHATLGHIHLELDGDGIARSAFLTEGENATAQLEHFALALGGTQVGPPLPGERYRPAASSSGPANYFRDHWVHIPFVGPPGSFRRVSYADVLKGAVPAGYFKDKFVMVGATAAGLGDAYPTPVSGAARAMPGVEISANVLDGLLRNRMLVIAPAWAQVLFALLPLTVLMLAFLRARPARVLQLWLGLLVGTLLGAWLCLSVLQWWFAPAAALAGLALAYPLWSWMRMEAALHFLADEFGRLSREPALIGRTSVALPVGDDLLEQRINEVRHGADHLRDLRRFVSESLESVPDPMLVLDTAGTVLLANRNTALLDAPVDGLAVLPATTLQTPEGQKIDTLLQAWFEHPSAWHALQAAAKTTEGVELEARNGRKFLLRAGEYHSESGTPASAGQILTLIDISPIRALEKSRDEALSFLSHDMRSPQSSIMALLELHRLDPAGMTVPDMLDRIERYANRTLSLSEQFVQLGRAESSTYHWAEIDLCGSLQDGIDEIWALAHEKQISVHFDMQVSDDGAFIKADGTMLSRVWQNLLSNAVKYSPAETTISVTITEHGGRHRVSIRDQGYGMTEHDVVNLFSRFRRFQQPGQPKAEGAGLGLVFVKTVVERHHGQVSANSAVGKGTEFVLEFPALPVLPAAGNLE